MNKMLSKIYDGGRGHPVSGSVELSYVSCCLVLDPLKFFDSKPTLLSYSYDLSVLFLFSLVPSLFAFFKPFYHLFCFLTFSSFCFGHCANWIPTFSHFLASFLLASNQSDFLHFQFFCCSSRKMVYCTAPSFPLGTILRYSHPLKVARIPARPVKN